MRRDVSNVSKTGIWWGRKKFGEAEERQTQIQSPAKHVLWTVQDGNKPTFSECYLATKNFNILFSLTFVIFPLGQYYISLWSLTGFHLHWDYLPGSKVSCQGGLKCMPKCMIILTISWNSLIAWKVDFFVCAANCVIITV